MKNWLILLFAVAVWHCEIISNDHDLKARLDYLFNRKTPYTEPCGMQTVPIIDENGRPAWKLIYETLED